MKKYTFLVYHKQYIDFLNNIREIGVLHVIEKPEGIAENDALREKMQLAARIKNVRTHLENTLPKDLELLPASSTKDFNTLLNTIETAFAEKNALEQKIATTEKEAERMEVWGNFDNNKISALKNAGFMLGFYACNLRKFDQEWEVKYNAFEIDTVGSTIYFVTVTRPGEVIEIDADPLRLNKLTATELNKQIEEIRIQIQEIHDTIQTLAIAEVNSLDYYLNQSQENIDFAKVILNTNSKADDKVMLLEGFCPEENENELVSFLNNQDVYFETNEPKITENVPIKLKNSSFAKLFEPVTNLFSLPNYSELDPTPFFAPFFMLFFGLCLGDGGYGLLIWVVVTLMKRKSKPEMKSLLTLGQYLGVMTIGVGILTGSFFGIALDQVEWSWLRGVKSYFITQANYGEMISGYNPMMLIAVIIGVIQILFGMIVNALKINKQFGFRFALNNLAWVVLILMLIALVGLPKLGLQFSLYLQYTFYAITSLSVLIVLFYNSPDKNPIANVGSALWNTYNMATGLLGDTLSYIRLFALGLTGSILGGVFNNLAFDLTAGANPYVRWLFVLLILAIGHSINFALSLIGAFVHPLRLTFVEFYKNAGFEGGGKAYTPFSRKIK